MKQLRESHAKETTILMMESQNQKDSLNISLQFLQQKIQQLENQPLAEKEKFEANFEQVSHEKLVNFLQLYLSF